MSRNGSKKLERMAKEMDARDVLSSPVTSASEKKAAKKTLRTRKTGEVPKAPKDPWTKRFRDGDKDDIEIHERSMPDGRTLTVFETRTRSADCPKWDIIISKPNVAERADGYPVVRAYGLATEDAAKQAAICLYDCVSVA